MRLIISFRTTCRLTPSVSDECLLLPRYQEHVLEVPDFFPMWAHHLKTAQQYEDCALGHCSAEPCRSNHMPGFDWDRREISARPKPLFYNRGYLEPFCKNMPPDHKFWREPPPDHKREQSLANLYRVPSFILLVLVALVL